MQSVRQRVSVANINRAVAFMSASVKPRPAALCATSLEEYGALETRALHTYDCKSSLASLNSASTCACWKVFLSLSVSPCLSLLSLSAMQLDNSKTQFVSVGT